MVELGGMIYVSTSNGLFKFPADSNMQDRSLWQKPISKTVYTKLVVHDSHLFGCKAKGADEINLNGTPLNILENTLLYFLSVDNKLIFGTRNRVFIYEGEYTSRWKNVQVTTNINVNAITCHNDRYYIAGGMDGLNSCIREETQFVDMNRLYSINSPRNDLFYHINYEIPKCHPIILSRLCSWRIMGCLPTGHCLMRKLLNSHTHTFPITMQWIWCRIL